MQILIVSATIFEIDKLIEDIEFTQINENFYSKNFEKESIDILITGIGIAFTIYSLTKTLNKKKYDLVLNIGIAGSLSKKLKIGDVVQVISEEFADLGIRSKDSFSTLFDTGFIKANKFPFVDGRLKAANLKKQLIPKIKQVNGITVNTVNGNKKGIEELKKKFNADIESMEGAAVFYVCLMEKLAFTEIRSISNYVEERNKENWDIPLALSNLHLVIKKILSLI
ncbi:MAG: futalosine hydrolase [Bacteroidetes bacterium]|nr:MAG: futalosine hydrolase [Bacteroidota bacterium]